MSGRAGEWKDDKRVHDKNVMINMACKKVYFFKKMLQKLTSQNFLQARMLISGLMCRQVNIYAKMTIGEMNFYFPR